MSDAPLRYTHQVFFRLSDRTPKTRETFLEYCWTYLSGHKGMVQFDVGLRDIEMQRPVNEQGFDVSVTMIFDRRESYELYTKDPRHHDWITLAGSMSIARRVYDYYVLPRPADPKGSA